MSRRLLAVGLAAVAVGAVPARKHPEARSLAEAEPPLRTESSELDPKYNGSTSLEPGMLIHVEGAPRIVFAITTGKETANTRARFMLSTWCSDIKACVFFSDTRHRMMPQTVPIGLEEYGFDDVSKMDVYRRAQLRFMPAFATMRGMILSNYMGKFRNVKWMVMCDDDTYVLHKNLELALQTLKRPDRIKYYTGNASPHGWFASGGGFVHGDGHGHNIKNGTNTPFVNGGGGSIFSIAAIKEMKNVSTCLANMLPHRAWDGWQSDWMLGRCAAHHGIGITHMPKGTFNQFACSDVQMHVHACSDQEKKSKLAPRISDDAPFVQPATIHPVKTHKGVMVLRNAFPHSATRISRDVFITVEDGDLRMMTRGERVEAGLNMEDEKKVPAPAASNQLVQLDDSNPDEAYFDRPRPVAVPPPVAVRVLGGRRRRVPSLID